jgi:hypothetical protein
VLLLAATGGSAQERQGVVDTVNRDRNVLVVTWAGRNLVIQPPRGVRFTFEDGRPEVRTLAEAIDKGLERSRGVLLRYRTEGKREDIVEIRLLR